MRKKLIIKIVVLSTYVLFIVVSFMVGFDPGKHIGSNFVSFFWEMVKIIPCAFILIGLFEVWVKRETIEKHLGEKSGFKGYLWTLLLASTTAGGLVVAFTVAYSLFNKGARLSVIFTYVGASAICRVPMTIFEATFLGLKFSLIRLFVSLPLVIVTSMILGEYLSKRKYKMMNGK